MATKIKLGNGNWGVKENGLLAYNDEDNVFKAIEMDFSRSSTATRESSAGLITDSPIDTPRIDFSDSSEGALLLEPSRTNLLPYSEDFSDAYWSKSAGSIIANDTISPYGSSNADKFVEDTSNSSHGITRFNNIPSGNHQFSAFFKSAGRTRVAIGSASGVTNTAVFDLESGVVVRSSEGIVTNASIENYGNGWYRCVANISSGPASSGIYLVDSGTNKTYTGDGVSGVYIFGAQLEAGSYATSYIPNFGTALGVTRIAETCSKSGLENYINSSEGVLYVEMSALSDDGSARIISISDGTINNRIHLFFFVDSNKIYANYRSGGVTRSTAEFTLINILELNKFAYKWKSGDFALWVNGAEVATDSNTTMIPIGVLDKLAFEQGNGGNEFYGKVKDLRVYDTALSDEELQNLTTL